MFQGWRVLGLTLLTQTLQAGLLVYGFGVVILPFATEFAVPRQTLMFASTLMALATNLLSPTIGSLIERGSIRRLMLIGAIMLALGFVLLSQVRAIWHVLVIFALVLSLANLLLGQLTSATLMARWFTRMRGRAMGFSAVGTSIGGLVMPPILAALIAQFGWRTGFLIAGIGAAVLLIAPILWLVVDRPSDVHQFADGAPQPAHAPVAVAGQTPAAAPIRDIVLSPRFWQITAVIGLTVGTYLALLANLVPHATDLGIPAPRAAFLMSVTALCAIPGKLAFGVLADRIGSRTAFWIVIALTAASLAVLLAGETFAGLVAACVLLGLAGGGLLPLWGVIVAQAFGQANFGRAAGAMNPAMMPFTLLAAPFAGRMYDRTGSYEIAFGAGLVALALAALLNARLRPAQRDALA